MKILHIFKNTNEKFSEPFIDFIISNFKEEVHKFAILGLDKRTNKTYRNNMIFITKLNYLLLIKDMYSADKIILHALMSPHLTLMLFFQPWLLKKSYWVVWGSDLYYYKNRSRNIKSNIYEFFRRNVICNMGGFITYCKAEHNLIKRWYLAKGIAFYTFFYPSNLFKNYASTHVKKDKDKVLIQIGNSSDPSNNHLEVFEKLEKYKHLNIEIICPLSYGDLKYRDIVISKGEKFFGKKFIPITEFMEFNKYINLLNKIDIAIFNHNRQQAMGNITTLIGLGKKVYIRKDTTSWEFFKENNLTIYDASENFEDLLIAMDIDIVNSNIVNAKINLSLEKLISDWTTIFNY